MIARLTILTLLTLAVRVASGMDRIPELSDLTPDEYHAYVGDLVRVSGRVSLAGKWGPVIDTGQLQICIFPPSPGEIDHSLDNQRVVVIGILRFVPQFAFSKSRVYPRLGPFFYFDRDYTVHYPSPWPPKSSNQAMQLTTSRVRLYFR
jgi:hypothetical protein